MVIVLLRSRILRSPGDAVWVLQKRCFASMLTSLGFFMSRSQIRSIMLSFRSCNLSTGWYVPHGKEIYDPSVFCKNFQTTAIGFVRGSFKPTDKAKRSLPPMKVTGSTKFVPPLGAFQTLPIVRPAMEIWASGWKKIKKMFRTKVVRDDTKSRKKKGAMKLDGVMKELAVSLRTYQECFPRIKHLHPYERSLIVLTIGIDVYEKALGKLDVLRKRVVCVGKNQASLCSKTKTSEDSDKQFFEGLNILQETLCEGNDDLLHLRDIVKTLRSMPVFDLEEPTLCLVGAPNVGKSSLVSIISTAEPEICNYPFTTTGILMGHIYTDYGYYQVTDTPGILKRNDEDRNNLEKLTFAVLSHLPTAVLYVHDLSEHCGMSATNQFLIYKEVKERFGDRLWIDVVSKCDLERDFYSVSMLKDNNDDDAELASYLESGPPGALHVSVTNEIGLSELKDKVLELLVSQKAKIQLQKSVDEKLEQSSNVIPALPKS